MTYQSHLAWSAGAAASVWAYMNGTPSIPGDLPAIAIWMTFALIGGLLPDIDHPQSWLGRRVPLVPTMLYKTTGHRGATHSLLAAALVTAAIWYGVMQISVEYNYARAAGAGILIGYLAHLAGDFVSNRGVPLFWPCAKRIGVPLCSTGSGAERGLTIAFIFLSGFSAFFFIANPPGA